MKRNNLFSKKKLIPAAITLLIASIFFNNAYGKPAQIENNNASASALYNKALSEYNKGDLPDAYNSLKFILNNYTLGKILSPETYYLYGKVLYKFKDFFNAKPYFQRVIYKYPDYKNIYNVVFYMARCDFNLKNYRRSIRDFDFLLSKNKKGSALNDKSLVYLTISYASCGRIKEANKFFKTDNVETILKKEEYLKKRSNYFKLVYLNYLINGRKNLPEALVALNNKNLFNTKKDGSCYKPYFEGVIALKSKKLTAAQNYFAASSEYCSAYYYHSSLLYYGIALIKQNNPAGLKYIKNETLDIDRPKIKRTALKFLAGYYGKNKKNRSSLMYVKRILFSYRMPEKERAAFQKSAANLLYKVITGMYKKNDFINPFKVMDSVSFLIPKGSINPKIYLYFAKMKLKTKDKKGALVFAKQYYGLSKNTDSKFFLAQLYYDSGKYGKALSLINKISIKNVKNNKLKENIINLKLKLYKKLKKKGKLVSLLKSNIATLPPAQRLKNIYFLALYEFNENNMKAAAFYFNDILKNRNTNAQNYKKIMYGAYYYLGLINYKFGNFKASLLYFKKGYGLNKTGGHFQYELSQIAYIYMKNLNNGAEALKYYNLLERNAVSSTYKSLASSMVSAINMQK